MATRVKADLPAHLADTPRRYSRTLQEAFGPYTSAQVQGPQAPRRPVGELLMALYARFAAGVLAVAVFASIYKVVAHG